MKVTDNKSDWSQQAWLIMAALIVAMSILPFIVLVYRPDLLEFILGEDGIYETMQMLAFFSGAILMAHASVMAFKSMKPIRLMHAMWVLFALALVVCGLEEIDYGQRIFRFSTPSFLQDLSMQGAVNIHNLYTGLSNRILALVAITIGFFLPIARLVFTKVDNLFTRFQIDLPKNRNIMPFAVAAMYNIPKQLRPNRFDEQEYIAWITISICLVTVIFSFRTEKLQHTIRYMIFLTVLLVTTKIVLTTFSESWPHQHYPYEIKEWFNAFGFLCFAWQLDRRIRLLFDKKGS